MNDILYEANIEGHRHLERMAPRAEVLQTIGIKSPATLYDMIRKDGFPAPYEISKGRKCWAMSEVQAWLAKKMSSQRKNMGSGAR